MTDREQDHNAVNETSWLPEGLTRPPVSPPAVWPDDYDQERAAEKAGLEAAIAAQQQFIDAMTKHLQTVIDPAKQNEIENRIAEHITTMHYLQRQLHNY
jgi:hypothetical protein